MVAARTFDAVGPALGCQVVDRGLFVREFFEECEDVEVFCVVAIDGGLAVGHAVLRTCLSIFEDADVGFESSELTTEGVQLFLKFGDLLFESLVVFLEAIKLFAEKCEGFGNALGGHNEFSSLE